MAHCRPRHGKPRLFYSPGFNVVADKPCALRSTAFDLIHLRVPELGGAKRRLYYKAVVRPAVGRARAVLTVFSIPHRAGRWSGADPDRIVVIGSAASAHFTPNGDAFQPGFPYVLYVGNQKPHKNLVRLVQAFARSRERDGLRLVLTGAPNRELVSLARRGGVDKRLVFLGSVPDEKLPHVYRGAVAFLFPSLYQGFGLPPLEAMACGTPVVSSTATLLAEVVGRAAVVIDRFDVDSIADGIDKVVRDEALRAELRERGIARARHFSWIGQRSSRGRRCSAASRKASRSRDHFDLALGERQRTESDRNVCEHRSSTVSRWGASLVA